MAETPIVEATLAGSTSKRTYGDTTPDTRPGAAEILAVCDPGIEATALRVLWELEHAPLPDGWTATVIGASRVSLCYLGIHKHTPHHRPMSADRWLDWPSTADTLAELIAEVTR